MSNAMNKKQQGVILLESLMAILIFSLGILSIVALLGVSVKNSSSAKYRTEASLLANQVIGQMETGQRTYAALLAGYASPAGTNFVTWQTTVADTLPGVSGANLPTIEIAADQTATITVRWQAPGDNAAHKFVTIAKIAG
jgi:type IV pilus assembly protein PilV